MMRPVRLPAPTAPRHQTESPTRKPAPEGKETASVRLGALLDARNGAVVTLEAGDTRLVAHRAVLVGGSAVFASMFRHRMLEARRSEVVIPDVEGAVLRELVAYLYTLQPPQLPDMAPQLLIAADKYEVLALKEECEKQLAAQLSVESAAATAVLAIRHSCSTLRQAAIDFIRANLVKVMATEGWIAMVRAEPDTSVEVTRLLSDPPAKTSRRAPAAPAPPPAARRTPPPADAVASHMRGISAKKKDEMLIKAARGGDVRQLRILLVAGADVDARDYAMSTALHRAAFNGHVEAARRLLEAGADVGARDSSQNTPLHVAARWGYAEVVRLLAEASADLNARGEEAMTALHVAALNGRGKVAKALLQAGADKGAMDILGETPLEIARGKNDRKLIQILS